MDIIFATKRLEKLLNNDLKLEANLGEALLAKQVRLRLSQLRAAETLDDLRNLPGNWHELAADRKGQWAGSLNKRNRLIITPQERPIPTSPSGQYIWAEIRAIEILEIADYHGK